MQKEACARKSAGYFLLARLEVLLSDNTSREIDYTRCNFTGTTTGIAYEYIEHVG